MGANPLARRWRALLRTVAQPQRSVDAAELLQQPPLQYTRLCVPRQQLRQAPNATTRLGPWWAPLLTAGVPRHEGHRYWCPLLHSPEQQHRHHFRRAFSTGHRPHLAVQAVELPAPVLTDVNDGAKRGDGAASRKRRRRNTTDTSKQQGKATPLGRSSTAADEGDGSESGQRRRGRTARSSRLPEGGEASLGRPQLRNQSRPRERNDRSSSGNGGSINSNNTASNREGRRRRAVSSSNHNRDTGPSPAVAMALNLNEEELAEQASLGKPTLRPSNGATSSGAGGEARGGRRRAERWLDAGRSRARDGVAEGELSRQDFDMWSSGAQGSSGFDDAADGKGRGRPGNRKGSRTNRHSINDEDGSDHVSSRRGSKRGSGNVGSRYGRGSSHEASLPPDYKRKEKKATTPKLNKEVDLPEEITVRNLGTLLGVKRESITQLLSDLGELDDEELESEDSTIDDFRFSAETAEVVAQALGYKVRKVHFRFIDPLIERAKLREERGQVESMRSRAAVVSVMGHVDHGKTTLLDNLRNTSVAAKEAGGITQHIGAFQVPIRTPLVNAEPTGEDSGNLPPHFITFLDTPGHAAFSNMRARGAALTDIAVLVVAADDGVKPQTLEALAHLRAANVPFVVAINKCDKPGANPERVRQELIAHEVMLEEAGGDVQAVNISALRGEGLADLEEALLLQAEMLELAADPESPGEAVVVESRVDKGRGAVVVCIVREGTLRVGDIVVVGTEHGRIRSLTTTAGGESLQMAGPSTACEISGLKGVPDAGEVMLVVDSEDYARDVCKHRFDIKEDERLSSRPRFMSAGTHPSDDENSAAVMPQDQVLNVVVKTDVHGTCEAVTESLAQLSKGSGVRVDVVFTGVGAVSSSDVALAAACDALVVAFNVRPASAEVEREAKRQRVEIRRHSVIYHLLSEVGELLAGKMPGEQKLEVTSTARVLQVFHVKLRKQKERVVAGCRVLDGTIRSNQVVHVRRNDKVVLESECTSLKRERLEVDRVSAGHECGVVLEGYEPQEGDVLDFMDTVTQQYKAVQKEDGSFDFTI